MCCYNMNSVPSDGVYISTMAAHRSPWPIYMLGLTHNHTLHAGHVSLLGSDLEVAIDDTAKLLVETHIDDMEEMLT